RLTTEDYLAALVHEVEDPKWGRKFAARWAERLAEQGQSVNAVMAARQYFFTKPSTSRFELFARVIAAAGMRANLQELHAYASTVGGDADVVREIELAVLRRTLEA
ncbi:MAG TPA: hypothetical protein VK356_01850, partial [Thermomicrobiales bacterium]|nr:hypothetical protein [Thermomicrobiales bacterium]